MPHRLIATKHRPESARRTETATSNHRFIRSVCVFIAGSKRPARTTGWQSCAKSDKLPDVMSCLANPTATYRKCLPLSNKTLSLLPKPSWANGAEAVVPIACTLYRRTNTQAHKHTHTVTPTPRPTPHTGDLESNHQPHGLDMGKIHFATWDG